MDVYKTCACEINYTIYSFSKNDLLPICHVRKYQKYNIVTLYGSDYLKGVRVTMLRSIATFLKL